MGEYYIKQPDELYHYGVKGMKWGVRKEPYSKEQIRQRRQQLIDQAPKSAGKRRSSSAPPTKGYWKNASDAQVSRLMDSEAKQARKANKKPMSTAKKVAIGVGVAAAVAGASYLALTKTDTGRLATHLGKSFIDRTIKTSKSIHRSNISHPGRDKANYLPKTMRRVEKKSRRFAKEQAKRYAQKTYKDELGRARRRNYMYTLDGRPNYTKNTMRKYEALSKSTAKNLTADEYARYYEKELMRARRMNSMYHL